MKDLNRADNTTIRLDPVKARQVDTALDLFAKTVKGQLDWKRHAHLRTPVDPLRVIVANGFSPREYEAADAEGKWRLTISQPYPAQRPEVALGRFDAQDNFVFNLTGIAALVGLAAAVESVVQDDRAA